MQLELELEPLIPNLAELNVCLSMRFSYPVIVAMLQLVDDPELDQDNLDSAWQAYTDWVETDQYTRRGGRWLSWTSRRIEFATAVKELTGEEPVFCHDCEEPLWQGNATFVDSMDAWLCEPCTENYSSCDRCGGLTTDTRTLHDSDDEWCLTCCDEHAHYCGECGDYYEQPHIHGCDCVAPHLHFQFPNNGKGTVHQDERFTVEVPSGVIDQVGLDKIMRLVQNNVNADLIWEIPAAINEVGPQWQAKRGNFTRRLTSLLFKKHTIKLPPAVISEIGNLARAHSDSGSTWNVEFTRDLNRPASDFYNGGSCWWGCYAESRCALKNWGGLALRTFNSWGDVNGRAWVQPLDEDLEPTHETLDAHAYVVYNSYGDISQYVAARIVAYLTGKTYRRIHFRASPQYVNGESAVLVADEATCADTEEIELDYNQHEQHDAHAIRRAA